MYFAVKRQIFVHLIKLGNKTAKAVFFFGKNRRKWKKFVSKVLTNLAIWDIIFIIGNYGIFNIINIHNKVKKSSVDVI